MRVPIYRTTILSIVFAFVIALDGVSQSRPRPGTQPVEKEGDKKEAKDNFSVGNYKDAIPDFVALLRDDPKNTSYNFKLGVCYLETHGDKTLAIPYLETALKDPKRPDETILHLGRAYMHAHQFDDAVVKFNEYKKLIEGNEDETKYVNLLIKQCGNAKKLVLHPIQVRFENLGPDINTPDPEYNPYIPPDEDFLVYTTRSKKNVGDLLDFDKQYPADVFLATAKSNNNWRRGRSISSSINTELTEEGVGLSADGNHLFIFIDNFNGFGDLWYSEKRGRSFGKADPLERKTINSTAMETSATMTNDQQILIFSTDYEGGYGGQDLYICRKLPNGAWGYPQNMGPKINTEGDEQFPALSYDQTMFYFASNGPNSMGGFDIFSTKWMYGGTDFPEVKNMGYPLNSTAEETTISFDETGRYAYMGLGRKDGYGDLDIYRVTIEDVEPRYTLIIGNVLNPDSSITGVRGRINVTEKGSAQLYGTYIVKPSDGRFIMILPPGQYQAVVEMEGLEAFQEDIRIPDRGNYVPQMNRKFVVGGSPPGG
ncbi:MAG: PD40 domain-containing protein [Flavobacteriales bacterium]|nr:PD40 domain-containing protein [Flavobacteriales bacterium]